MNKQIQAPAPGLARARASARRFFVCMAVCLGAWLWLAALVMPGGLAAADKPPLVAPVYPGAVPGVQGTESAPGSFGGKPALPCSGEVRRGSADDGVLITSWCFLTRDPIERVRAFYEGKLGAMHAMAGEHGERGFAVFLESQDQGELGTAYAGLSVHTLPQPVPIEGEGMALARAYAQQRHLNPLANAVDWSGAGGPGEHKPAELVPLHQKYKHLELAFFVRNGAKLEPRDQQMRNDYGMRGKQAMQSAQHGAMRDSRQAGEAAAQRQARAGATEDKELQRLMERKPALTQRYVALTRRTMELMQAGKYEEAEQAADEADALLKSDPELAAWARKQEQREAGEAAVSRAGAARRDADMARAMDYSRWGVWLEYLSAVEKEAYYTLIVIDEPLPGPKVERDRNAIAQATAATIHGPDEQRWGLRYSQEPGSAETASPPAAAKGDKPRERGAAEQAEDAVRQGLNRLNKLF